MIHFFDRKITFKNVEINSLDGIDQKLANFSKNETYRQMVYCVQWQVSSTYPTAPMPKFGTSVRRALEDGLVG